MLIRNKRCRVGLTIANIRNLVIIALDLPGSVDGLGFQFCRQSCHCEYTQLIAIGSTGDANTLCPKCCRGDIHSQILRRLLREERRVCPGVNEGERGLAHGLRLVSCGAVLDLRCAYHRGIPDPDLKAALRIFRRDGLSVCRKVYQCLCVKSNILSIGGSSVICSLEQQTRGVIHTNCIILPKRRVVGDSGLFIVGFLCPEFGVKAVCFEFFEKAGRGQLQGRTPQIAFIICFTYIFIEIAICCTAISTIHYSCTISITCNSSYTNAMIDNCKWTIAADSCRRRSSLHVSFKKALGNHSTLSGIAADSTCCMPFYRSSKGAAINFTHRQISANSSCNVTRNDGSVGSQQHYLTAFFFTV